MRIQEKVMVRDPPTLTPSFRPVRRRPTHRGAGVVQGVKVERATVRTTLTPWASSARLCLGRWWSGWKYSTLATTGPRAGTAPPSSRCWPIPAGGIVLTVAALCGTRLIVLGPSIHPRHGRQPGWSGA